MINVKWSIVLNFTFNVLSFDLDKTGDNLNKSYLF